jgi:hypothetical protein
MQRLGSNSVASSRNLRLKNYCAWLRNCLELHRQKARRLIGGIRNGATSALLPADFSVQAILWLRRTQ